MTESRSRWAFPPAVIGAVLLLDAWIIAAAWTEFGCVGLVYGITAPVFLGLSLVMALGLWGEAGTLVRATTVMIGLGLLVFLSAALASEGYSVLLWGGMLFAAVFVLICWPVLPVLYFLRSLFTSKVS